ncbi:MAG: lipopolysaccharide heptosyltransferase II [Bdellovibrionales bacterium]|nr:lipopolysaccharide heptosyltransferase II [Bdellovibrionales bacterium]
MKILLIQTGFLGDVVLSTPVIAALADKYPGSQISFLTTPQAAGMVQHHPQVEETLVFDKRGSQSGWSGLFRMAAEIRARKFDAVFSLHKSWRTTALVLLSGIPKRYGFRQAKAAFVYSAAAERRDLKHEVLRNLAVMRAVGFEPSELPQTMHIEIPPDVSDSVLKHLTVFPEQGFVAVAPGSVWATKRWTPEGFAAAAQRLIADGYGIVILGGPADSGAAESLQALLATSAGKVVNLAGETSLLESAAVIACAKLLISNDSAPLHIASAVGTPVVAVFCATVPEFGFGPWGVASECVGLNNLECRPCARHGGNTCPLGTYACQRDLPPEHVYAAAKRVVRGGEGSPVKVPGGV